MHLRARSGSSSPRSRAVPPGLWLKRGNRFAIVGAVGLLALILLLALALRGSQGGKDAYGISKGSVSYQEVSSRPEAHLYYRGSQVLESHAAPEKSKYRPAYVYTHLAAEATPQQIGDWYRDELLRKGWHLEGNTPQCCGGHEYYYLKARRERFDLTIFGTGLPQSLHYDGKGTVYSIHYEIGSCATRGGCS